MDVFIIHTQALVKCFVPFLDTGGAWPLCDPSTRVLESMAIPTKALAESGECILEMNISCDCFKCLANDELKLVMLSI